MKRLVFGLLTILASACRAEIGVGPVQILAGNGMRGSIDASGINARLDSPTAVDCDPQTGFIWFFDKGTRLLRRVDISAGNKVQTLQGLTKSAYIDRPDVESLLARNGFLLWTEKGAKEIWRTDQTGWKPQRLYKGSRVELVGCNKAGVVVARRVDDGVLLAGAVGAKKGVKLDACRGIAPLQCAHQANGYVLGFRKSGPQMVRLNFTEEGLTLEAETVVGLGPFSKMLDGELQCGSGEYDDGSTGFYIFKSSDKRIFQLLGEEKGIIILPQPNGFGQNASSENMWHEWAYPYTSLGGLCVDEKRRCLIIADTAGDQLLLIKERGYHKGVFGMGSRDFENDFACPRYKPSNAIRIICYGSSVSFVSREENLKFGNLNKQVETALNLMGLAEGTGKDYEVIFDGSTLALGGVGTDVFSLARSKVVSRSAWNPDAVLLVISPLEVFYSVMSFLYRPLDDNGLPGEGADPEFYFEKNPDKKYKGLAAEIYGYFKRNRANLEGQFQYDASGVPTFRPKSGQDGQASEVYPLFAEPEFDGLVRKVMALNYRELDAAVQKALPGRKTLVATFPQRNHFGRYAVVPEERFSNLTRVPEYTLGSMTDVFGSPTFKVVDLGDRLLRAGIGYHPLFYREDHPSGYGSRVIGTMVANELWPFLASEEVKK